MNAIEFAARHGLRLVPTGSRVICDPPVMDTDIDYTVYIPKGHAAWDELQTWWVPCGGDEYAADTCRAFRRGNENIIAFHDENLFDAMVFCTTVAKRLNLTNKVTRVAFFAAVREDVANAAVGCGLEDIFA